jgi:hypothetical protein
MGCLETMSNGPGDELSCGGLLSSWPFGSRPGVRQEFVEATGWAKRPGAWHTASADAARKQIASAGAHGTHRPPSANDDASE